MYKIFIGCPITKYLNGNIFTNEDFKRFINKVYDICTNYADEVFLALKREEFGKNIMSDVCTELDYKEMMTSDLVVAIPDDSKGTAVELGWASVMKKRIILILNTRIRYTPLITGLNDITDTVTVLYDGELNNKVLSQITEAIKKIEKGLL